MHPASSGTIVRTFCPTTFGMPAMKCIGGVSLDMDIVVTFERTVWAHR